jgi:ribokinase
MAIENQTRVILNPAPARPLPSALLEKVDILIANETEILVLTNADEVGMQTAAAVCRPLHEAGVESVIMTQGKEGALVTSKNGDTRVPGLSLKPSIPLRRRHLRRGCGCDWPKVKNLRRVLFANAAAALSPPAGRANLHADTRRSDDSSPTARPLNFLTGMEG